MQTKLLQKEQDPSYLHSRMRHSTELGSITRRSTEHTANLSRSLEVSKIKDVNRNNHNYMLLTFDGGVSIMSQDSKMGNVSEMIGDASPSFNRPQTLGQNLL